MWVRRASQRAEPQASQKPDKKDPNNQYNGRRAGRLLGAGYFWVSTTIARAMDGEGDTFLFYFIH
jgi:hypothetical protein